MTRVLIPPQVAGEVLFASQRTCCVCREPGKPVQIHHIDGDPSNNAPTNLAVLCLPCHNETLLTGGFARHLDSAQIRQFRDDWLQRVVGRRNAADRLATEVMAAATRAPVSSTEPLQAHVQEAIGSFHGTGAIVGVGEALRSQIDVGAYVRTLPELRRRAYAAAQPEWDSGVTSRMLEASYRVIDVLQDILATLARAYPTGHFDTPNPKDYISELIASRFRWHRYHHEPDGQGRNGTIALPMVAASVTADLERMILEMVVSLTLDWSASTDYDFRAWQAEWQRPGREPPRIDVQVFDGKSVMVTATNKGRPFTLVLRARLTKSNLPIDHGYPYEYIPRNVGGGDVIKNYTIAEMSDHRKVLVFGEGMAIKQIWNPTSQQSLTFEVALTFLAKEDFTRTIGEYVLTVSLATGSDRLSAELRQVVPA